MTRRTRHPRSCSCRRRPRVRSTPSWRAAGQAVILAPRPGVGGVIALAWRRKLETDSPADPKLHEFVEAYLAQGPSTQQ